MTLGLKTHCRLKIMETVETFRFDKLSLRVGGPVFLTRPTLS